MPAGPERARARPRPSRASSGWCRSAAAGSSSTAPTSPGYRRTLIARHGIAWVPDNRRVFPTLTVERNLAMALFRALCRRRRGDVPGVSSASTIGFRSWRDSEQSIRRATVRGGEAQLVAIARALLLHPRLVLMDKQLLSLAQRIVEDIMAVIQEIRADGTAILLVEQNSSMALGLADRAYVIDDGRIVHAGAAAALEADLALKHRLLAV